MTTRLPTAPNPASPGRGGAAEPAAAAAPVAAATPAAGGPPIVELRAVSKAYATGDGPPVTILDEINLQVQAGEMLALLGQSGSGKSTILRLLAGLSQPTRGSVLHHGQPLRGTNHSVSIVFQTFALFPWLTVSENVRIGLLNQRRSRREEEEQIEQVLDLIGLSGYENAYPKELSGGMRQRVGFARALVARPEILCMDEAFSALDVLTAENLRAEVVNLWRSNQGEKRNEPKSIFFVTHNIEEAVFMASRIVIISSHPGRIRHVIDNPLPYPRDPNSADFNARVEQIHAAITALALPDEPPAPPTPASAAGQGPAGAGVNGGSGTEAGEAITLSGAAAAVNAGGAQNRPGRIESIPPVPVSRVFGLVQVLADNPDVTDLFELSNEIGRGFSDTIAIVKAAELLDFVDTPKQNIYLTALGRELLTSGRAERKAIFARQIMKLRLFRLIVNSLEKAGEPIDADVILQELAILHPYEQPENQFESIVAWGRYAEIIDYDQDSHTVSLQADEA